MIKQRWDTLTLIFLAVCLMVFALCRPMVAVSLGQKALILAAKNVVPSLFVYAVGAKLLVGANVSTLFCRLPMHGMRRLFGVSEAGLAAVFVGLFAGFPVGVETKSIVSYLSDAYSLDESLTVMQELEYFEEFFLDFRMVRGSSSMVILLDIFYPCHA